MDKLFAALRPPLSPMAASCHLLHLPLPKSPTFRPIAPSRLLSPLTSSWGETRLLLPLVAVLHPFPAAAASPAGRGAAKVLAFSSGYNVQVTVGEDEPEEVLLRRFRREVTKAGVIQECKRRRFYENKHEERKRKAREATRRNRRRRPGPRGGSSSYTPDSSSEQAVEDDDNWDMPEGNLPY